MINQLNLSAHKWSQHANDAHPWTKGINSVIDSMIEFNEMHPDTPFNILRIKEKFGFLRFYYNEPAGVFSEKDQQRINDIKDSVTHITNNSHFVCSNIECQSINGERVEKKSGWLVVLCADCQKNEEE